MITPKRSKFIEFSKVIIIVSAIINLGIIIFSCVMIWRTEDLTPLAYIIPAVAGEVATGTGFYYNKAKQENLVKLQQANPNMKIVEQEESIG